MGEKKKKMCTHIKSNNNNSNNLRSSPLGVGRDLFMVLFTLFSLCGSHGLYARSRARTNKRTYRVRLYLYTSFVRGACVRRAGEGRGGVVFQDIYSPAFGIGSRNEPIFSPLSFGNSKNADARGYGHTSYTPPSVLPRATAQNKMYKKIIK